MLLPPHAFAASSPSRRSTAVVYAQTSTDTVATGEIASDASTLLDQFVADARRHGTGVCVVSGTSSSEHAFVASELATSVVVLDAEHDATVATRLQSAGVDVRVYSGSSTEVGTTPAGDELDGLRRVVRDHQALSQFLLRRTRGGISLGWMEQTSLLAGCLAVADTRAPDVLRVSSAYEAAGSDGEAPADSIAVGAKMPQAQFPPIELVELAAENDAICLCVPVVTDGIVRGQLAVVTDLAPSTTVMLHAAVTWGGLIGDALGLDDFLDETVLFDSVTELPNRRYFLQRLDMAVVGARNNGRPFAVVFLDLDHFKLVNDAFGHQAGDDLLAAVADRLSAVIRPGDVAARFGGDEFAVLLQSSSEAEATVVVERLSQAVAEPIRLIGHEVEVTGSFGVAVSSNDYSDSEAVLRDADTAMYHAKANHRGGWTVFNGAMHTESKARLDLLRELRLAFERDEFELFYQAIFDSDAGDVAHFEALIRWRHPERGLVPPGLFLPALAESGSMVQLGRHVVDLACRQLRAWHDDGLNARVSVNVSHAEFWDHSTIGHVEASCKKWGVDPHDLIVEITEDVVAVQPELAVELMEKLRAAGFELYVDDFGIGSSSLHALYRYPVTGLKIDQSFVFRLGEDDRMPALVKSICEMGAALGLDIIAEGVEYPDQILLLRSLGCRNLQGFALAKPAPAHEAQRLMRRAEAPQPEHALMETSAVAGDWR